MNPSVAVPRPAFDLLIRGGTVYDGTGAPPRIADVGVRGDRIAAVGSLPDAVARETVSAEGCGVCPGFIDVHTHSDVFLLVEPDACSKIAQGVTTEIVGNCGASAAPRGPRARMPSDWSDKPLPPRWETVAEYRERLAQARPAVNVALLAGHNTLRATVLGYERRAADAVELSDMERRLEQALEEGALGLSTGLLYPPGRYAPPDELPRLARVLARRGAIYATHFRSEGDQLLEALDEALAIGRAAGGRVQISHLKTSGRTNWGKLDAAFERLERARGEGMRLAADRYPYLAGCTDLDVLLPDWATVGSRADILARLRDPATRTRIRDEVASARSDRDWAGVWIGAVYAPEHAGRQGRPLVDAAAEWQLAPVDAWLRIIEREELRAGGIFFGLSEENLGRILARPWVMIGSDGSARAPGGVTGAEYTHPRAYGSFARFLRMALDGRAAPPEEAIRKMTSLPAGQFGLRDRGALRPGAAADVVVFDPAAVRDRADYAEPHRPAEGFRRVVVNGVVTWDGTRVSGPRAGRWLAGD